jgi:Ca2+-binding RTX toxin-like protein
VRSPFTFTVTRSGDTTGSTSVKWAVAGSGANPANATDFGTTLPSGTLNFTAGQTSQVITVNVKGDIALESDENFTVTLSDPTPGTTLTTASTTGTIQNDDTLPTFAIAPTNANQTEGNSGNKAFTFTVTRTGDTTGANNVNWAVSSSGLNPVEVTDFGTVFPSGTLAFAVGQTSQVVTVNVKGDAIVEPDESFTITLSNPTNGALIGTVTATSTVINDDIIIGTTGNDLIAGSTGNDTISGLAGLDTLSGLAGNDSLDGGAGNDLLTGGLGNDTLLGGTENDTLNGVDASTGFGQNEIDRLTGGTGSDRFVLGDSARTYYLGNGRSDYAIVTDFASGDVIQTRTGDVLTIGGTLPTGIASGTALYLGTDLVAVVQGAIPTSASFIAV